MSKVHRFNDTFYKPLALSARNHLAVQLPNGIIAFLINDPTDEIASCSLSVATGAFKDPDEIPGLAHLCEHMLMGCGSKAFPNPNTFHEVVSKFSGKYNAVTTGEFTSFSFQVPSQSYVDDVPAFEMVLDIFSSSFKEPLFVTSIMEKEVYSVDSEHQANKSLPGRLMYHGYRILSNKEHPFHRFTTGNLATLSSLPQIHKHDILEMITRYFYENFIGPKITVVLKGPQSITMLQKMTLTAFGAIRSTYIKRPRLSRIIKSKAAKDIRILKESLPCVSNLNLNWSYTVPVFTDQLGQNTISIDMETNCMLRLLFPIHHQSESFQYEEFQLFSFYWCKLFGDESEGSLFSYLQSKDYVKSLSTSYTTLAQGNDALVLEVTLTNYGSKKLQDIIEIAIVDYICAILSDTSEMARYLSELSVMDMISFLFQDRKRFPMEETCTISQSLQQLTNPSSLLHERPFWGTEGYYETDGGSEYWFAKAANFERFVRDVVRPKNMMVVYLGRVSNATSTDPHFGFSYSLSRTKCRLNERQADVFKLPSPNYFIPNFASSLTQVKNILERTKSPSVSLAISRSPSLNHIPANLHLKNEGIEVWKKSELKEIKTAFTFELTNTRLEASPTHTVCLELFSELLGCLLKEKLYPSELVGSTYEISGSQMGDVSLSCTLTGFGGGVIRLTELILQELMNFKDVSLQMFRKLRIILRTKYETISKGSSLMLANFGLLVLLEPHFWSFEDRLEALEDLDIKFFTDCVSSFLSSNVYIAMLVQGETSIIDELTEQLLTFAKRKSHDVGSKPERVETNVIKTGKSYCVERFQKTKDPNNAISYFIQTGHRGDTRAYSLTVLINYVMSMTMIPKLKNDRQLGYIVTNGLRILTSSIGIHFSIMSQLDPQVLEVEIGDYLHLWECEMREMSEKQLEMYISEFLKQRLQVLNEASLTDNFKAAVSSSNIEDGLGELLSSHRQLKNHIRGDWYGFKDEPDISFIQSLTRDEFMQFVSEFISIHSRFRSKVSIMIRSKLSMEEIRKDQLQFQIETFCRLKGLNIDRQTLQQLIEKSNGKPSQLLKFLLGYFWENGKSMKLCSAILGEFVKSLKHTTRTNKARKAKTHRAAIKLEHIDDIAAFKNHYSK